MKRVLIIGAGPAGLSCAYKLRNSPFEVTIVDAESTVGGLSKTIFYKGYRFDIGGHRFHTREKEVSDFWAEVFGGRFLRRQRKSRIVFNDKMLDYPLKLQSLVRSLSPWMLLRIFLSYAHAVLFNRKSVGSFQDWVVSRFGRKLFDLFFRDYTEKVWGIPCERLSASWADERIQNLSVWKAVCSVFMRMKNVRTLVDEFDYPPLGPGQFWDEVHGRIQDAGCRLLLGCAVVGIEKTSEEAWACRFSDGTTSKFSAVVSTMPLERFVEILKPTVSSEALFAARSLRHRSFVMVTLLYRDTPNPFPDNWIYVQSPKYKLGRIQNFRNWSPLMTPGEQDLSLGLEYFCDFGDQFWSLGDEELAELAKSELHSLGLAPVCSPHDYHVVRSRYAYPVYECGYEKRLGLILSELRSHDRLYFAGRGGLYQYNNQDHAILAGFQAARQLISETGG